MEKMLLRIRFSASVLKGCKSYERLEVMFSVRVTFSDNRCIPSLRGVITFFNPLKPNDPYSGRTAPLTSKRYILYIYSTNIGTEYFKYGIYAPILTLQNAVCFIILTYLVPVLLTFNIQSVLKLKKIIPAPTG